MVPDVYLGIIKPNIEIAWIYYKILYAFVTNLNVASYIFFLLII